MTYQDPLTISSMANAATHVAATVGMDRHQAAAALCRLVAIYWPSVWWPVEPALAPLMGAAERYGRASASLAREEATSVRILELEADVLTPRSSTPLSYPGRLDDIQAAIRAATAARRRIAQARRERATARKALSRAIRATAATVTQAARRTPSSPVHGLDTLATLITLTTLTTTDGIEATDGLPDRFVLKDEDGVPRGTDDWQIALAIADSLL